MAEIELVIKIPEEVYNYIMRLQLCNMAEEYIKNGTPLPKGHGRLIDADKFNTVLFQYKEDTFCNGMQMMLDRIDNAPTIIEADKEEIKDLHKSNTINFMSVDGEVYTLNIGGKE